MNSIRKYIILLVILIPIFIICIIYYKVFRCGAVLNKSCYGEIDYSNMILINKNITNFQCEEYNLTCVDIELNFESDTKENCTIILWDYTDSIYYNIYILPLIIGNEYPIAFNVDGMKCNLLNSYNDDIIDTYLTISIGVFLGFIIFCVVYIIFRLLCTHFETKNLERTLPGYAGHAI